MLPEMSKVIGEIEAEIKAEYLGGAIRWADENRQGGWSEAIDRFEKAIDEGYRIKNFEYVKAEMAIYRDRVIGYIREYKKEKGIDDTASFLASVGKKT
jgi:hypothetical protein